MPNTIPMGTGANNATGSLTHQPAMATTTRASITAYTLSFLSALAVGFLLVDMVCFTLWILLAFVAFVLGMRAMGHSDHESVSNNALNASSVLVGYAPGTGIPLYNFRSASANTALSTSFLTNARWFLRQVLENYDSRQIFYFLCINLSFMFIEFLYGIWSNSLGLISDAFHMLFDCAALFVGLYASVMSKQKATRVYSYGYNI